MTRSPYELRVKESAPDRLNTRIKRLEERVSKLEKIVRLQIQSTQIERELLSQ